MLELKKAAKSVGGTVNDAFVSAVLGGLRHYHDRHGEPLGDVPISMPVSVRRDDDPMGGNRFTGAFFSAPSAIADPAERIRAMHDRVLRVRQEPALDIMNKVTPLMNLPPTPLVAAAISGLNAGATLTTVTRPLVATGTRSSRWSRAPSARTPPSSGPRASRTAGASRAFRSSARSSPVSPPRRGPGAGRPRGPRRHRGRRPRRRPGLLRLAGQRLVDQLGCPRAVDVRGGPRDRDPRLLLGHGRLPGAAAVRLGPSA